MKIANGWELIFFSRGYILLPFGQNFWTFEDKFFILDLMAKMFANLTTQGFELTFLSHAAAILSRDFPEAVIQIESALENFKIPITEIIGSGGGETIGTQRLRKTLDGLGWQKTKFEIKKIINGVERESITHEIDHVKAFIVNGRSCNIALEIEWNNKDPFFDRDLENFKRLHAEGAISIGIIITRGSSLQDSFLNLVRKFVTDRNMRSFNDLRQFNIKEPTARQQKEVNDCILRGKTFQECWTEKFVNDKFGAATTHWRKLMDRVNRGVGNPCPLLLIGLPAGIITFD